MWIVTTKQKRSPERRVGKTANLVIFIGILYSCISLLGLTVCGFFVERGYGVCSLIVGLVVVGLGYGIRYGKMTPLYVATGLFTSVSIYYTYLITSGGSAMMIIRLLFCVWVVVALGMAIPAMLRLKAAGSLPDRGCKYRDFFLRRKALR